MDAEESKPLLLLLKAPSKEIVEQVFQQAFLNGRFALNGTRADSTRSAAVFPALLTTKLTQVFEAAEADVISMLTSAAAIIDEALFESLSPQQIFGMFPDDFNKSLKQLIAAIISKNAPTWRDTLASNQISLARLVETDWRVDVKTSSDSVPRMAAPSVIMELKVLLLH